MGSYPVSRSVRYCSKECQVADYKATHKDECQGFVHPPFTTAFITQPYGDNAYPPHPIFGSGHEPEGVGYWVSIRDRIETECAAISTVNDSRTDVSWDLQGFRHS